MYKCVTYLYLCSFTRRVLLGARFTVNVIAKKVQSVHSITSINVQKYRFFASLLDFIGDMNVGVTEAGEGVELGNVSSMLFDIESDYRYIK